MVRPHKRNIEYYSHDVKHGKTIFLLEQEFGNNGYALWWAISNARFIGDLRKNEGKRWKK